MGLRSAAQICQRVTSAFAFMMFKCGLSCLNYLDDFGGVETEVVAQFAFHLLRTLFLRSGIDEAFDKACPPAQCMVFLGVLFNSLTMTMSITKERLHEIRLLIQYWISLKEVTLNDIQKLLGKLNFVGSCVRSSRIFVNRILNWLRECYAAKKNKGHKFIIPVDVQKDLLWWDKFLPLYNGISLIDYGEWSSPDKIFSTDCCLTGFGGLCEDEFFHGIFPEFILRKNLSITCLEMLTVMVAIKLWCHKLVKKKINIFCDNLAVCIVLNTGKAKNEFLQQCLREISFVASVHEFQLMASHLSSSENRLSDDLSRMHLNPRHRDSFFSLLPQAVEFKDAIITDELFQFTHDW